MVNDGIHTMSMRSASSPWTNARDMSAVTDRQRFSESYAYSMLSLHLSRRENEPITTEDRKGVSGVIAYP